MKKNLILFSLLLLASLPIVVFGMSRRSVDRDEEVKVLVYKDPSRIKLTGSVLQIYSEDGRLMAKSEFPVVIARNSLGLTVNGRNTRRKRLQFVSERGVVTVQGKPFRGKILISKDNAGNLLAVNQLPIELYLRGVVASEMPEEAPMEALKAQAVAARTYTLYHARSNGNAPYDLGLPENSQAYRGVAGEHPRSDKAVRETKGIVLEYNGELFPSFFHTRCGGYTLKASEVWPKITQAPEGVRCRPCLEDQKEVWKFWIRTSDLWGKLIAYGFRIPKKFSVTLHRDSETQRVKFFQIQNQFIPTDQLRNIVGPAHLKSTIFWAQLGQYSMRFYGRGWGHGVGMCQQGARALAAQGISYKRILSYYYPKSRCVRIG